MPQRVQQCLRLRMLPCVLRWRGCGLLLPLRPHQIVAPSAWRRSGRGTRRCHADTPTARLVSPGCRPFWPPPTAAAGRRQLAATAASAQIAAGRSAAPPACSSDATSTAAGSVRGAGAWLAAEATRVSSWDARLSARLSAASALLVAPWCQSSPACALQRPPGIAPRSSQQVPPRPCERYLLQRMWIEGTSAQTISGSNKDG